jgi:hypothetical protein
VDFYLSEKNEDIQVCHTLNSENIERETQPLLRSDAVRKTLISFEKSNLALEGIEARGFLEELAETGEW